MYCELLSAPSLGGRNKKIVIENELAYRNERVRNA